jgi:hypothetical protein
MEIYRRPGCQRLNGVGQTMAPVTFGGASLKAHTPQVERVARTRAVTQQSLNSSRWCGWVEGHVPPEANGRDIDHRAKFEELGAGASEERRRERSQERPVGASTPLLWNAPVIVYRCHDDQRI